VTGVQTCALPICKIKIHCNTTSKIHLTSEIKILQY